LPGCPIEARTAGAPIKGVIVKGSRPGAKLTIADDIVIKDLPLLTSLGVDALVIAKGEYVFNYSTVGQARTIVHLHKAAIVHRDIAARSFVYQGTDADGNPYTYTIEPLIESGTVNDLQVTVKLQLSVARLQYSPRD